MAVRKSQKFVAGSYTFCATPTGLKTASRSKVENPRDMLKSMSKGDRRKTRKALRSMGRVDLVMASL